MPIGYKYILMLRREIIAVCSEIDRKHENTHCSESHRKQENNLCSEIHRKHENTLIRSIEYMKTLL
jgi:hypothetical protein